MIRFYPSQVLPKNSYCISEGFVPENTIPSPPFANNDLLTCRNMDRSVITVKIECIIIHCWCIKVDKLWSKALCLILHCQINGVFQEDVLQVVVISGWWMSTNKLSLAFSLCVLFSFVLSFRFSVITELQGVQWWAAGWESTMKCWSGTSKIYIFFLNCSDSLLPNLLVRHQLYTSPTIHHWCKCGVFFTTETAFKSDTRHMVVVRLKAG